ncbi:hypothetical protein GN244_ATG15473 [Phytophthora infestans]|uniref:Uncharacterized protein n=1 Tax=Phytophthora infestans TaxID=4787 RepID=A0A833SCY3_PHYIN|nr:hypothetical protein GN244_ATG15473 [Phytophthora infestans]
MTRAWGNGTKNSSDADGWRATTSKVTQTTVVNERSGAQSTTDSAYEDWASRSDPGARSRKRKKQASLSIEDDQDKATHEEERKRRRLDAETRDARAARRSVLRDQSATTTG